jgi:hypothetical protein
MIEHGLRSQKPAATTLIMAKLELQLDQEYKNVIPSLSHDFLQYELVEFGR